MKDAQRSLQGDSDDLCAGSWKVSCFSNYFPVLRNESYCYECVRVLFVLSEYCMFSAQVSTPRFSPLTLACH